MSTFYTYVESFEKSGNYIVWGTAHGIWHCYIHIENSLVRKWNRLQFKQRNAILSDIIGRFGEVHTLATTRHVWIYVWEGQVLKAQNGGYLAGQWGDTAINFKIPSSFEIALHEIQNDEAKELYEMGIALWGQKHYAEASEIFHQAHELTGEVDLKHESILKEADCYMKQGQHSKALELVDQALQWDVNHELANRMKAEILNLQGRFRLEKVSTRIRDKYRDSNEEEVGNLELKASLNIFKEAAGFHPIKEITDSLKELSLLCEENRNIDLLNDVKATMVKYYPDEYRGDDENDSVVADPVDIHLVPVTDGIIANDVLKISN